MCIISFVMMFIFFIVVLLDAPTGMSSDVWAAVYPEIAKITKVCLEYIYVKA